MEVQTQTSSVYCVSPLRLSSSSGSAIAASAFATRYHHWLIDVSARPLKSALLSNGLGAHDDLTEGYLRDAHSLKGLRRRLFMLLRGGYAASTLAAGTRKEALKPQCLLNSDFQPRFPPKFQTTLECVNVKRQLRHRPASRALV